ncbi:MAG: LysR family transcriptional regulator [Roseibium sp.]|uniref:LysR family transcriptional regulator n=1 Tax=Roseibium sp. TaxID=1936156 RepID=UPI00262FF5EB|nr:LysR family transcriptional regulator [Roseibium sp.]MCV0429853.1 LysR family transcriptional regulator [Roseibium sp.]
MRIDWLEDLVALLDAGSVVEAASLRNISQSAFSRRIQALESLLDVPLIDRDTKPNRPTPALKNHEDQLRLAVTRQRQLIQQIQMDSRSGSRLVVIACQHAITTSLGPRIVKAVSRLGTAHVRLRSANLDECEVLLMTGQADFSLTYQLSDDGVVGQSGLTEGVHVADERLVPVYSAAGSEELFSELRSGRLNVISYPPDVFLGQALSKHVMPAVEGTGKTNVVAETALTVAALEMARAGVGVAFVPEALVSADLAEARLIDLRDQLGSVDMEIVGRRRQENAPPLLARVWEEFSKLAVKDQ